MNLKSLYLLIFSLFFSHYGISQTVRIENKYGTAVYFVDGDVLKANNRYGNSVLYYSENTLRLKNRYGEPLYYFDGYVAK